MLLVSETVAPVMVSFEDLCSPCGRAVHALLKQVGKQIDGHSPDRKPREAKKKEEASKAAAKPVEKKPANGAAHVLPHAKV